MSWDPTQYARFAAPRSRPFFDLLAQVGAKSPARVLDVGCGTGVLTARLSDRWPDAEVSGVDASPAMVAAAPPGVRVERGRAQDVDATGLDVLVSNAALQWVPEHRTLLTRWAGQLDGGWLAVQVPASLDAPSHRLMRELADSPAWRPRLAGVLRGADTVASPAEYVALLSDAGMTVDAWQTTYLHLLTGPDPVLEWVRGTGLRPVLDALEPAAARAFSTEYAALLREAYPAGPHGTVFPFTRTFVVAHGDRTGGVASVTVG